METITKITYNGKDYPVYMDMNVLAWAQEEYGSFSRWQELMSGDGEGKEPSMKCIIASMKEMINEGIDYNNEMHGTNEPFISLKLAGRIITQVGINSALSGLQDAIVNGSGADESADEAEVDSTEKN